MTSRWLDRTKSRFDRSESGHPPRGAGRIAALGLNKDVQAAAPFALVIDYLGLARNAATASCTVW
jgi:hypothetical protein